MLIPICRTRRHSHFLPSSNPYATSNECQDGLHRLPPADNDHPGSSGELQAKGRSRGYVPLQIARLTKLIYSAEGEENNGTITERMVRSVEHYPAETIVVVHGKLRKAPKPVKNATIHDYEIDVYEIHKVSTLTENVPFTVYDAENINRDKEDVAEDNIDDAGEDDSKVQSPQSQSPRSSIDLSRLSQELLSKSEFEISGCWNAMTNKSSQPAWMCRERKDHCLKECV